MNQWHTLSSLGNYTKEVGEKGLEAAIYDLSLPFRDEKPTEPTKTDIEPGVSIKYEDRAEPFNLFKDIDGISDSSTSLKKEVFDGVWPQRPGPSHLPQPDDPIYAVLHSDRSNIQIDFFCANESAMTTQEMLGRFNKEQLVGLAKEMKCKIKPNSKASPYHHISDSKSSCLAERRHYMFASTSGCKSTNS